MKANEFKTKTIFKQRKNVNWNEQFYPIAMDIGYSALKGFSENAIYSFPSYARKVTKEFIDIKANNDDIQYKDCETGEIWVVGASAQALITIDDSKDSEAVLYGRNRYFSPMFQVIARVGMGIGMTANEFSNPENKTPVLQTGLPPAYLKADSPLIIEALSGHHSFNLKLGNGNWTHYEFDLPKENIYIMKQPMGTLLSIATDNNGNQIGDSENYFSSNVLIFDPGFGTFDCFYIKKGQIDSTETFDNLGMKRVLKETSDEIFKQYHLEISVSAMQNFLKEGTVPIVNIRDMKSENKDFTDILEEKNKIVCMEAIEKIKGLYNFLIETNYLVLTGGTGAAWSNIIRDYLSGMKTLHIISGNQNDELPYIFSNVRGYYMYLVNKLKTL